MENIWSRFIGLKRWQKLVIIAVLLGAAGSATGGSETKSVSSAQSGTQKPAVTKDPLQTSDNQTACTAARREVSSRAQIITDASNGAATYSDAASALGKLGDALTNLSFATGGIGQNIADAALAFKQSRVSLLNGDLDGFRAASGRSSKALDSLNVLCASIGY